MSKLRQIGTYLRRVIDGQWSLVTTAATLTAAYWDGLVSAVSHGDVRELATAGAWPTNWLAGIIVLALCVIGLFGRRVYVLESEKEPMLTLRFDARKDEHMRLGVMSSISLPALYVLVLPVVASNKNLTGCVGRLADISVFKDGRWRSVAYGTSVPLRWQDQQGPAAFSPLTLHPESMSRQFLDVFSVAAESNLIGIENVPRVIINEVNFAPKVRLAVSVVAEGEDAAGGSAKIVLEVEKTTDWSAPKVRAVSDLYSDE